MHWNQSICTSNAAFVALKLHFLSLLVLFVTFRLFNSCEKILMFDDLIDINTKASMLRSWWTAWGSSIKEYSAKLIWPTIIISSIENIKKTKFSRGFKYWLLAKTAASTLRSWSTAWGSSSSELMNLLMRRSDTWHCGPLHLFKFLAVDWWIRWFISIWEQNNCY